MSASGDGFLGWRRRDAAFWARLAIMVQFLAITRTLSEIWRLRYVHGAALAMADVLDYVNGALIAAVLCWVAVGLYFGGRYRAAVWVAVAMVALLLGYKAAFMG
ncbi:MAG: hypothetical protein ABI780_04795 [Ardenticatenales bacterium]